MIDHITKNQRWAFELLIVLMVFIKATTVAQPFTDSDIVIPGVTLSSVAVGDYNNDGLPDFVITGSLGNNLLSKVYSNNGDNTFTESTSIILQGVHCSSAAWGDYDNDGDLDLVISGSINLSIQGANRFTALYRNDGNNSFSIQSGIVFPQLYNSSVSWGDYDNDGLLDILLTGSTDTEYLSLVYRNNGNNTFLEQSQIELPGVSNASAGWEDFNNDGFLDIYNGGRSLSGNITQIFRNNGNHTFTKFVDTNLLPIVNGTMAWSDYDNDGDLDLIVSGEGITKIYRNEGDGNLVHQTEINLIGLYRANAVWGDFDNDGLTDILLTGSTNGVYSGSTSVLYRNNGNNTFTQVSEFSVPGVINGSLSVADLNMNGRLDIIITGTDINNTRISKILYNQTPISNTPPLPPSGLISNTTDTCVFLKWERPTDDTTPPKGLGYNVRVGTASGANNIVSGMNSLDGSRLVSDMGNAHPDTFFILINIPKGTYYWSVQSIDHGYSSSSFSSEQSFQFSSPIQASLVKSSKIEGSSIEIQWQRGNGSSCMVFAYQGIAECAYPVNGVEYSANPTFGLGSQIGQSGWYCVYNGEGSSVKVNGIKGLTEYTFQVIEFDSGPLYYSNSGHFNPTTFKSSVFTLQSDISLPNLSYGSVPIWGDYNNDNFLFCALGHPI